MSKTHGEMQAAFPGRKVFKQMKTLFGERHEDTGEIVDEDYCDQNKDDPALWEWVVQRFPKRKNSYDPSGVLTLQRSAIFRPTKYRPDPGKLNQKDRREYMDEKMMFLGTPKPRWREKTVEVFAIDEDNGLIRCESP